MDNLDNYLVFTTENILTQVYYRQVLSETSWFELTLGRNFNRMHTNVNGNDDFTTYDAHRLPPATTRSARPAAAPTAGTTTTPSPGPLKGAYSFMGAGNNKFKTGFDLSFTEMQLIDLQRRSGRPAAGQAGHQAGHLRGPSRSPARPISRTRIEYRGLIVNAGHARRTSGRRASEVEKVMANPDDYLFIYRRDGRGVQRQYLRRLRAGAGRCGCRRGWA